MNAKKSSSAVALSYDATQMSAPQVSLQGKSYTAEKILSLARRYGIPMHRNQKLVEKLADLSLDQEIPQDLYQTVAEILHGLDKE